MNVEHIIAAWKNPGYRASLSAEQLAAMPANPAGEMAPELAEDELARIVGGYLCGCGWVCTSTTECTCDCTLGACQGGFFHRC